MRFVYDILFTVVLFATAPLWLWRLARRGEWRRGFGQRLGRYSTEVRRELAGGGAVWLHAVSVGEVNLVVRLVELLADRLPGARFVVSATTNTGRRELDARLPSGVPRIYYPLDRRAWVRRAFEAVRPRAIVLVEAEIWPNYLAEAGRRGIPTLLVNARVSERSARRYRRLPGLFGPLFAGFETVTCPTPEDATRLAGLGCRSGVVHVVGHPKFDAALAANSDPGAARALLDRLGVPSQARVIVGGSTHPGEEALLAAIYRRLRQDRPDLFLVLVPRHFERCPEAAHGIRAAGVEAVFRTRMQAAVPLPVDAPRCLLVDTTGELRGFYAVADLVVIGKSLIASGGQNPIEPAALGRAIVTGPNMQNFRAIHAEFLRHDAVCQVPDADALEAAMRDLLDHREKRAALGARARAVVEANRGALERTADAIIACLGRESNAPGAGAGA